MGVSWCRDKTRIRTWGGGALTGSGQAIIQSSSFFLGVRVQVVVAVRVLSLLVQHSSLGEIAWVGHG